MPFKFAITDLATLGAVGIDYQAAATPIYPTLTTIIPWQALVLLFLAWVSAIIMIGIELQAEKSG